MTPRCIAYLRLSREDDREPGSLEEKFQNRAQICQDLASRHGLTIIETIQERESGSRLANRPGVLRLLDLVTRGECTHIVTPEQARLLRGDKRDEQTIEDALVDASIILITSEGVTEFGSEEYDPLPFEVRALVARHELRIYRRRRQSANRARLSRNERSCGFAPYGYRRNPEASGGYETIPEQYAILQEIFSRLSRESQKTILRDLNQRGVPTPGTGKKKDASPFWQQNSLRRIILNPFYAGYHAQRYAMRGKRRVLLPEPVLAEEEGDWVHPITLLEWRQIVSGVRDAPSGHLRSTLLSGILYCAQGRRMTGKGASKYNCHCRLRAEPHLGQDIGKTKIETWVKDCLFAVLSQMPDDFLKPPGKSAKRSHSPEQAVRYQELRKRLIEHERFLDDLRRNRVNHLKAFGDVLYAQAIDKGEDALAGVMEEIAAIDRDTIIDQMRSRSPLIARVKAEGPSLWDAPQMTLERKRTIVRAMIQRIDIDAVEEGRRYISSARITWHDWVIPLIPPDLPALKRH